MKINFYTLFLICVLSIQAQNRQILFGFDEIPQNLMVNPSAKIHQKYHVSVPMLSGVYANIGISGFTIADLFADDGFDINTKLEGLIQQTSSKDYYTIHQQVEVFNAGFTLNNKNKDYISFGFYEEFDFILYHPKDLVTLFYEGNQDLTKTFNLNHFSLKGELLGVFHVGINRKINSKISIGLRAKLYSSVLNATSRVNHGTFSTFLDENNIYAHRLVNADLEMKISGILNEDNQLVDMDRKSVINRFLASGNMGAGLDFGIDYKVKDNIYIKASLIDLGFIRHVKNTKIYQLNGSYTFDGIGLLFPEGDFIDYWKDFEDEFDNQVSDKTSEGKYTTMRSLKLNTSIGYQFGESSKNNCIRPTIKTFSDEIGLQVFSIFRPKQPQFAATIYYHKYFSKHLQTRVTYTIDDYNTGNIGAGFSSQIGKFNLYATLDNIIGLTNLAKSKNQSFQFGMNLILN